LIFLALRAVPADSPRGNSRRIDMTTLTGTVTGFDDNKGYGFIVPDGGGEDLFAHGRDFLSDGSRTLQDNQRVQFTLTQGPRGGLASNIRPLAGA
jgi:CspA family cold shock protein